MPAYLGRLGGGTGGGGGLHFRDPADIFSSTTLALARTARDTAFSTGGTLASVLGEFQGDQSLAIIIRETTGNTQAFETYLPADVGDAYDATQWVERTDAVQGDKGDVGPQARFTVSIFQNATTAPTTPTGGSFVVETGVLTPPTGWTALPTAPGATQNIYESQFTVNPRVDTGTLTPVWSVPVEPPEENAEQAALAAQAAAEAAQTAAATSQTEAAASASIASTSATAAAGAETNARTAETNAETAETAAETAETAAELAQTRAEAAQSGAETALQSSGAALAFHDLWSGDIDITTANQWKPIGTVAVPSNATWLIWNGGQGSDGNDDGPAALSTWINAAVWRALTADTVDTTPGDGTGMLMVDWIATNIGDGTPDFARRDAVIGRTSADIPLITSTNTGEDFYGASLKYITQAVSTPGGGGSGGFTLRYATGTPADSLGDNGDWYINTTTGGFYEKVSGSWNLRYTDQVGAGGGLSQTQVDARITALAALLTGATFTGAVKGITPVDNADLSRKDYVDTADNLRALLAGAIFTGAVSGITPTADTHLSRKDYVDTADNLRAELAGATFTGATGGIAPVNNSDFVTLEHFNANAGGGGMVTDDIYFGTSDDAIPENAEFTIPGVNGSGLITAYSGAKHHIIARLDTEADITRVIYSDDASQTNQIGGFTKYGSFVMPGSETADFNAWVSNQALTQSADVTITVS